ncbi:MAG: hypothetical protein Q7U11_22415, partial [Phenylobacterium sp.]|nr:hypothetical protein [Phenylobacterium sp.]
IPLIPAKAGTQIHSEQRQFIRLPSMAVLEIGVGFTWVPAFAGMSGGLPIAERDPSSDRSPTGHRRERAGPLGSGYAFRQRFGEAPLSTPQGEKGPTS